MEKSQKYTTGRQSAVCVDNSTLSQQSGRKRERQATEEDPMWNTALDKRLREMFGPCSESTEKEDDECDATNLGCHRSGQIASPEHHRKRTKLDDGCSSKRSDISDASNTSASSKEATQCEVELVVKAVLFPYYFDGIITKDEYGDILRRAVPKIPKGEGMHIDRPAIESFIGQYVSSVLSERRTKLMNTFISLCSNNSDISTLNSASTSNETK